ncbi:GNAT family N-acetyltransferase [Bacillus sp. NEB1478]|uniref:GNAT family N-acetyltransferase n=1 Tax=Bacillus sp. NEB1478 TaxID=3073816 RepID=UPI002873A179|nr:GNAT family N-acetyltransferase [Bacillus sp. NEB1478]WNB91217.1 GNAT family N-acetyltransferase [Bacillus sp. NEB1478]
MQFFQIMPYKENYFQDIQKLSQQEGWSQLAERNEETHQAWKNSNITFVVMNKEKLVIGYVRGLTDGTVTTYICEMLISKEYRGHGIGTKLLKHVHDLFPKTRMEMLASTTSHTFYESQKFRPFYGFRKTYDE